MSERNLNLLLYAALAIGGYILWKKFSNVVGNVTAPAVNALADWYVKLTGAGQEIPTGVILMPDGATTVNVAALVGAIQNIPGTNYATFPYQGVQYYLCTQSDQNGNWAAQTSPC